MPEATISDVDTGSKRLHSNEPILTKDTHIFGTVNVYPPNADPSQWSMLSFLLTTEHGAERETTGLRVYLKASMVHDAFDRPHFIEAKHKYLS